MKKSAAMKAIITKLAEQHGVDLTQIGAYLRLELRGYMPLNIETIGPATIAISHSYIQEGDVMRDPEMVFRVVCDGWLAINYRQDNLGLDQDAVVMNEDGEITGFRPRLQASQASFAGTWARNLKEQGWLTASCTRKTEEYALI